MTADGAFRIICRESDDFVCSRDSVVYRARARGKLRRSGALLTGDFVTLDLSACPVIESVLPRKNSLIRPAVANVDLIAIVVAPVPEPDLYLVDKMIVNCIRVGIEPLVCLNKTDLGGEWEAELKAQYGEENVVAIGAKSGDLAELKPRMSGKLTCFAGQSAVGKSTIVNALTGGERKVGGLSERTGRGKNTTTSAAILTTDDGLAFIDTPGFSMLDVFEEDCGALAAYYDEFVALADKCRFHPCTHTGEPGCAVREAAASGKINAARYDRYRKIYEEIKAAKAATRR